MFGISAKNDSSDNEMIKLAADEPSVDPHAGEFRQSKVNDLSWYENERSRLTWRQMIRNLGTVVIMYTQI